MTELISRTYRFSQDTLDQIEWLGARLGGLDATNVLRVAIADLYHSKQAEWKARLVESESGYYDLQVGDQTLVRVRKPALERLPEDEQAKMLVAETDGLGSLVRLLLGAAAAGEKVWLDENAFDDLFGSDRDLVEEDVSES
jgi:hypothetical protein